MAAIFLFFHNCQYRYSVSVDTQKSRDPNFREGGGVSNLKFYRTLHIYEMATIFQFFHYSEHQYFLFLSTVGKPETQTLGRLVILDIAIWHIFMKWRPFFDFFIMVDADNKFPSTFGKLETQTLRGEGGGVSVIWKFAIRNRILTSAFIKKSKSSCHFVDMCVSFNNQKTRDLKFVGGGAVIWNFVVQHIFTKWQLFFDNKNSCHFVNMCWIPNILRSQSHFIVYFLLPPATKLGQGLYFHRHLSFC